MDEEEIKTADTDEVEELQPGDPGYKSPDWQDSVGEPYEHRGEDENGNGDDLYTEKEALALAKEQGIEFVDEFTVEGSDKVYETRKAAEKAAKGKNITQTRRAK